MTSIRQSALVALLRQMEQKYNEHTLTVTELTCQATGKTAGQAQLVPDPAVLTQR